VQLWEFLKAASRIKEKRSAMIADFVQNVVIDLALVMSPNTEVINADQILNVKQLLWELRALINWSKVILILFSS
jgi:hypothetical protein